MALNKPKVIATAQKYVLKGQYDKAIREYKRIIEEDPKDVRIRLKIGDLCAKAGATDEAIRTYDAVAEFYAEQGFYQKAVAAYKQILKLNGDLVTVNLKLAELYKQLGWLSDAMQQYERISNYYSSVGNTKDALAAVRQIVDLDPENIASRVKLAELYSKEGVIPEAIEEFSKAADYLRASGRIDDFMKVAERLIYHQVDNLAVTKELASLYLRKEDPRRALQKLQSAFKIDPLDEETLGMLAQAFEDLGQKNKTISVLKELARIHEENGATRKVLDTYQRILSLAPDDEDARRVVQKQGGKRVAEPERGAPEPRVVAEPRYEPKSVERVSAPVSTTPARKSSAIVTAPVPVGPPASQLLEEADAYAQYGMYDQAIDCLSRIFQSDPTNLDARLKLKELYVIQGKLHEASQELYTAAQIVSHTNRELATRYLDEALRLDPANRSADDLLLQLAAKKISSMKPAPKAPAPIETKPAPSTSISATHEELEDVALDAESLLEMEEIQELDAVLGTSKTEGRRTAAVIDTESMEGGVIELQGEELEALAVDKSSFDDAPDADDIQPIQIATESALEVHDDTDASAASLDEDLEEAEFFLQQNLLGEAAAILRELLRRSPGNNLVQGKLSHVERLIEASSPSKLVPDVASIDTSRDLAAELAEELEDDLGGEPEPEIPSEYTVEDVFEEFKRGVDKHISEEDSDTHYDLGIAYREMGLIDDAISEFRIAMRGKQRAVQCHTMIGVCLCEKGLVTDAINEFKSALYVEGLSDREATAIYFELGNAYESLDDKREALFYYDKVKRKDPQYRDVTSRIQALNGVASSRGESRGDGEDDETLHEQIPV